MRKVAIGFACALLLCAARAEAQCDREWQQMLQRAEGAGFEYYYGHLGIRNSDPKGRERIDQAIVTGIDEQHWREHRLLGERGFARPADLPSALRLYAQVLGPLVTGQGGYGNTAYERCRSLFLADQIDAQKRANDQAARDAAAKALRDQQARDAAARDAAAQAERARQARIAEQLKQVDEANRQREQQEIANREREKLQHEADEERERQEQEAADLAAAEKDAARRRQAEEARRKKEEEDKKPFVARIVNECVSLISDNGYGGFHNSCDFPVYVAFCTFKPKEGASSMYFDCDKNKGGLDHIDAKGFQADHTNFAQRVFYFACNAPSTPKVEYHAGAGFFGSCQ